MKLHCVILILLLRLSGASAFFTSRFGGARRGVRHSGAGGLAEKSKELNNDAPVDRVAWNDL